MVRISRSWLSCGTMVWSTFQRTRRHFGTPDVMTTDGGPEFRGDFSQSGGYAGILQVDRRRRRTLSEREVRETREDLSRTSWQRDSKRKSCSRPMCWEDLLADEEIGEDSPQEFPHELLTDDPVDEVGLQELKPTPQRRPSDKA